MNLSRLFTVQLSMFFVVFSNSDMLSHSAVFVNNFFIFLFQLFQADVLSFSTALIFYQVVFRLSRTFFIFLLQMFRFFATACLFYQTVLYLSTTFFILFSEWWNASPGSDSHSSNPMTASISLAVKHILTSFYCTVNTLFSFSRLIYHIIFTYK